MVAIGEKVECGACGHKRRIVAFVGGHDKLLCDACCQVYMSSSSAVRISADAVRLIATLKAERDALKEIVGTIYHFAERCPVCGQSKNVREGDELMPSGRKHHENCKLKAFL